MRRLFNESLPCGAELVEATDEGELTLATFKLTERPGPGTCGRGSGQHRADRVPDRGRPDQRVAPGDPRRGRRAAVRGAFEPDMSRRRTSIAAASWPRWRSPPAAGARTSRQPKPPPPPAGRPSVVIGDSVPLSGALERLRRVGRQGGRAGDRPDRGRDRRVRLAKLGEAPHRGQRHRPAEDAATFRKMADEGAGCIVGPWAPADVDRRRAIGRDPARRAADLAGRDARRDHQPRGSRPDQPHRPSRLRPGPGARRRDRRRPRRRQGQDVDVAARADGYGEGLDELVRAGLGGEGRRDRDRGACTSPETKNFDGVAERLADERRRRARRDRLPGRVQAPRRRALDRAGSYDPDHTWGVDLLASTELGDEPRPDLLDGVRVIVPGVPDSDAAKAFATKFDDADPKQVEAKPYAAQTFDAVVLCFLASVAADSTAGGDAAASLAAVSAPAARASRGSSCRRRSRRSRRARRSTTRAPRARSTSIRRGIRPPPPTTSSASMAASWCSRASSRSRLPTPATDAGAARRRVASSRPGLIDMQGGVSGLCLVHTREEIS